MCIIHLIPLLSYKDSCTTHEKKQIKIIKKIGEGANSIVFLLKCNNILKIYKNSLAGKTILNETNSILPKLNENREIQLFFKIVNQDISHNNIVRPLCLGIIAENFMFNNVNYKKNTYYSILPYYEPLSKEIIIKYNLKKLIKEIIETELNLEKFLNVFHLDITLENLVICNNKIMLIDYNLIKSTSCSEKEIGSTHFGTEHDCKLKFVPLYYIFLLIIYILFNNKNIYYNDRLIINYLYILSKKINEEVYRIIYNGLTRKFDTNNFYNIFIKN